MKVMKMRLNSNKINFKAFIALITMFFVHTACSDWMDIQPENELTQDEFWNTRDDVLAARAAAYDAVRNNTEAALLLGEIRADFISVSNDWPFQGYGNIADNEITITNDKVNWGEFYKAINLANTVIHFAPIVAGKDKTLVQEQLDELNAEMIFLRSLSYFYLVRIWKNVPLVTSATVSDTVELFLGDTTEVIVLSRIEKDLKDVLDKAPDDPSVKGYATKYAIQALLADILLWGEKYEECIQYCDAVTAAGYGLESTENWFNLYFPGNSQIESIFEIQYNDQLEEQQNPIFDDDGARLSGMNIDVNKYGYDLLNDIRLCLGAGPYWKFIGTDASAENTRIAGQLDVNYIYYRYADILFMKAEASIELNDFNTANELIKQVVERANVAYIPSNDKRDLRQKILIERSKEFSAEGKRWFDLLRFAKKDNFANKKLVMDILIGKVDDAQQIAIMKSKVLDTMSYYLPIHTDEIKANGNLKQNTFYSR